MDQGGQGFPAFFGVAPTRSVAHPTTPGSASARTPYSPDEGFTGLEDTLNNSAWAFIGGLSGARYR